MDVRVNIKDDCVIKAIVQKADDIITQHRQAVAVTFASHSASLHSKGFVMVEIRAGVQSLGQQKSGGKWSRLFIHGE